MSIPERRRVMERIIQARDSMAERQAPTAESPLDSALAAKDAEPTP
jgi:hypothetical protein